MSIINLIREDRVKVPLQSTEKTAVIRELINILIKSGDITDAELAFKDVMTREGKGSTGLEYGVAIPHAKTSTVKTLTMAIGIARSGEDALEKLQEVNPDVITLDINMPHMDGLTCLRHIMSTHPLPVVMISSLTQEGAYETFRALELGAVDFIPKLSGTISLDIGRQKKEIIAKVKAAAFAKVGNKA